jgi:inner membrane protein involved in colicin E2 resistance
MSPLRLVAIGAIFVCTTIAWMLLGSTIVARTGESDGHLRREVESLWGSEHRQVQPHVAVASVITRNVVNESTVNGAVTRQTSRTTERIDAEADLARSAIDVRLDLEHRKKGLLWWPTYTVAFKAGWRFDLPPVWRSGSDVVDVVDVDEKVVITVPMSARGAVYDGFFVKVDGQEVKTTATTNNTFVVTLPRGERHHVDVDVAYRSRGLGTWIYGLERRGTTQLRDFHLSLWSSEKNIDFPIGTLSPTSRGADGEGARIDWRFESLVTGQNIGIELPARLNPGPVAARISFFAPVSLLFFLTVMVIIGVTKQRSLHPMNYFFLAAAFFAFHLLLSYLVDVVDLAAAFAVSSVVSLCLVTSYLRIVQGLKAAVFEAGVAQLVFLVGFSLAFFHEGQTGLTVVVGSVVTLFILMQLTARVRWAEVFGGTPEPAPRGGVPIGVPGFTSTSTKPHPSERD